MAELLSSARQMSDDEEEASRFCLLLYYLPFSTLPYLSLPFPTLPYPSLVASAMGFITTYLHQDTLLFYLSLL